MPLINLQTASGISGHAMAYLLSEQVCRATRDTRASARPSISSDESTGTATCPVIGELLDKPTEESGWVGYDLTISAILPNIN